MFQQIRDDLSVCWYAFTRYVILPRWYAYWADKKDKDVHLS